MVRRRAGEWEVRLKLGTKRFRTKPRLLGGEDRVLEAQRLVGGELRERTVSDAAGQTLYVAGVEDGVKPSYPERAAELFGS